MIRTGTPAAWSSPAYCSASSRSGSYSAVITVAGGSPDRSRARSGEASGFEPSSWLARYIPQYQRTDAGLKKYSSANSRIDGVSAWQSVFGYTSS